MSQFLKRPVRWKILTWNKLSLLQKPKLKRTSWDEITPCMKVHWTSSTFVLRSLVQTMGIGHYGTKGTPKSLKFDWADQLLLLPLYERGTNKATMAGKNIRGEDIRTRQENVGYVTQLQWDKRNSNALRRWGRSKNHNRIEITAG